MGAFHPTGQRILKHRCLFRFTGSDRVRYLNGQVTNDVRKASSGEALYACVTSAKGKVEADVFLSPAPDEESLWVDGPGELREELALRLEKYIIADDVEMEDVTDQYSLWHALGEDEIQTAAWKRTANRFGVEGWDVIVEGSSRPIPEDLPEVSEEVLETLRIAHAVAQWGTELGPDVLPQEANLQDRAVDFFKGCYIGQEVISRIKSVGRVNRRLELLLGGGEGAAPEAGDSLWSGEEEVGRVTSVAPIRVEDRIIALGYVKRGYGEPGTVLTCRSHETERVCTLELGSAPFP